MDIINDKISNYNEKIDLIMTLSTLKNTNNIIYNSKNKNTLLIDNYYLEYSSIEVDSNSNNNNLSEKIINNLSIKSDLTLIVLTNTDEDSNTYINSLQNLFNKDNYSKYNINSISFAYSYVEEKDKINSINDILDIPYIENDNIMIKAKINFRDDMILFSCFKILIIRNSYEKICPYYCINHKDYKFNFIKDQINMLLSEEKKIQKLIKNIPSLNIDYLENIQSYKNEAIEYYSKFINMVEKTYHKFNNTKLLNKNDLNNFIKEANALMDIMKRENLQNKQNSLYQQYIKVYKDLNILNENEDLKSLFIKFNNLNEEIADILENNNFNLKEISNLKNEINSLQKELKQEKTKYRNNKNINTIETNYTINNNNFSNNTILTEPTLSKGLNSKSKLLFNPIQRKNISSSINKDDNEKESTSFNYHNKSYESLRTNAQEIKYLNKKINHLYDTITSLKNENNNLVKDNEKLKLNIKNLNRIIAKMYKNMGDGYNDNNDSLHNDAMVKSNSIKTLKAKIIDFKTRHQIQFSGNKRFKKNKNIFNHNTINNDDMVRNNSRQKYINLTINTNYDREYDNTFNEEEHNALLKKIQDENKNISLKINELYHKTDFKTLDKDTSSNSLGFRSKNKNSNSKKFINLKKNNKSMNFNIYASAKGNKGSVPKIKIYRKNAF